MEVQWEFDTGREVVIGRYCRAKDDVLIKQKILLQPHSHVPSREEKIRREGQFRESKDYRFEAWITNNRRLVPLSKRQNAPEEIWLTSLSPPGS